MQTNNSAATPKLSLFVDGQSIQARSGQTVAAAMLAAGIMIFRHTPKNHDPRGIFCGQGACFDCLVTIDGVSEQRACMTLVNEGMRVETIKGA